MCGNEIIVFSVGCNIFVKLGESQECCLKKEDSWVSSFFNAVGVGFLRTFFDINGIDNTNDALTPESGSIDTIEGNIGGKEGDRTCTSSP